VEDVVFGVGKLDVLLPEEKNRVAKSILFNAALLTQEAAEPSELAFIREWAPSVFGGMLCCMICRAHHWGVRNIGHDLAFFNFETRPQGVAARGHFNHGGHQKKHLRILDSAGIEHVVIEGGTCEHVPATQAMALVPLGGLAGLGENCPLGKAIIVAHYVIQEGVRLPPDIR